MHTRIIVSRLWALAGLLGPGAMASDVSMFRSDPARTGVYAAGGVPELHGVKWSFQANGEFISSPAVAGRLVCVGCSNGGLYAFDRATGAVAWRFRTGSRIASSPAIADGRVIFGSYDGKIYAVSLGAGKLLWSFAAPGERRFAAPHLHGLLPAGETMPDPYDVYESSPAIWEGNVFIGSGDGAIYALDARTGSLRWKYQTGDVVHASPAIANGRLFVGSWDAYFYALDARTGKPLWRFKTGEDPDIHNQVGIQSSAVVDAGTVYFGCRDSHLYALDAATGAKRWAVGTNGSWVVASPIVWKGKVYFATSDSALLQVVRSADGAVVQTARYRWPIFSSPALAGGILYLAGQDGKLRALDAASLEPRWIFQSEGSRRNLAALTKPDGSPNYAAVVGVNFYDDVVAAAARLRASGMFLASPVVDGGVIYIGSSDGGFYALH